MSSPFIKHRIYLQEFEMLRQRKILEIAPVDFDYQGIIIVATGLIENQGSQFVYQSNGCSCGHKTIRGVYLEEEVPWPASGLRAHFAAGNSKDRKLADQKEVDKVYRVRLPADENEKNEVAAALKSHFGANADINFF